MSRHQKKPLEILSKTVIVIGVLLLFVSCSKDDAEKSYQEAYSIYKEGNPRRSLELFEDSIKKNPKNLDYRLRYANALEDSGFFDKAINEYDNILQIKQDHILALVNLANLYRKQKDYNLAIVTMKKAISLKKKEPWMLDNFGNILEDAGKLEEAYTYYKQAATYEPNDPEFRSDLANVCMKLEKYDEARELYQVLKNESYELYSILKEQEESAADQEKKKKYSLEKEPYLKSYNYYKEMLESLDKGKK